jgi:hypothetical protein
MLQLTDRAVRIQAEAEAISQQEAALELAAAKAEASLDRAELLEKAKEVASEQKINRAGQGVFDFFSKLQQGSK